MQMLQFVFRNAGWAALNPDAARKAKDAMDVYRKAHPVCELSGSKKNVQIHHIIPVWQAPELAAEQSNFIALSASAHIHLIWGHNGNFGKYYVANIKELALKVRAIRDEAVVVERPAPPEALGGVSWWRRFVDSMFPRWRSVVMTGAVLAMIICSGCATRKPGGSADTWTTKSYAENDVIYNCVGVRF
jgi:hypothetical protein